MKGHSHFPSVGNIYSVTEDLAWNDISKIQNILWEQDPGGVEGGIRQIQETSISHIKLVS